MSGGGTRLGRRRFVRIMSAAGGGLVVGITFACRDDERGPEFTEEDRWFTPNAFVEVARSGRVRIAAPVPEVGQGVSAALPGLVAHELRVALADVTVWRPEADERFGDMIVAGSDAVADYWEPLRAAGAMAREALVAAAARRWRVEAGDCEAREGAVHHPGSRRSATYGELVDDAAAWSQRAGPPDGREAPPAPGEWPVRGPDEPAYDPELAAIVTGAARFGLDVRRPGMVFAAILRPPMHGGRALRVREDAARTVPGVLDVVRVEPLVPAGSLYGAVRGGVAVVASSTWAALRGRSALEVEWGGAAPGAADHEALFARMRALALAPPERVVRSEGAPPPRGRSGGPGGLRWVERTYETPLLAHVAMEPGNFTAQASDGGCSAWGPTQNPRTMQALIAAALNLERERVSVRPTRAGGGFGRRLAVDQGIEAAVLASRLANGLAGRPVQVVWTREDDVRHDYFRPPSVHRMRAALDAAGRIRAWDHHLVTSSLARASFGPDAEFPAVYDVQGAEDLPLDGASVRLGHTSVEVPLQLGSFRSVAHSSNVFAVQRFLDELAHAAGADPVDFRRDLLGAPRVVTIRPDLPGRRGMVAVDTGRMRRVLDAAAEAGRWRPGAPGDGGGVGQGVAFCQYKGTYVAHVAEVSAGPAGPRVERVVAAVDCGTVVDPNGVRAQAEGAALDAVATLLHWEVPYSGGRVAVSNFDDYPLARASDAPEVEVLLLPSGDPPTGMGEPPYPSAVPALATALSRALGSPVRRLPYRPGDQAAPG